MSNHRQSPPSKSPPQPGIRSSELQEFIQRIDILEKLVRENFDEKNQWNSKVREWIGKPIFIRLSTGNSISGILQWVDRYTICTQEKGLQDVTIIHKGAVVTINAAPE